MEVKAQGRPLETWPLSSSTSVAVDHLGRWHPKRPLKGENGKRQSMYAGINNGKCTHRRKEVIAVVIPFTNLIATLSLEVLRAAGFYALFWTSQQFVGTKHTVTVWIKRRRPSLIDSCVCKKKPVSINRPKCNIVGLAEVGMSQHNLLWQGLDRVSQSKRRFHCIVC